MIKCVIHCSDIHIRNFQRLSEYAEQLTRFVEKCKEIAKDYEREEVRIVIAGDLVHQKNNISNELTALFDTANFQDCKFLDSMLGYESGFVEDDNIVWCLYSIYSGYNPPNFNDLTVYDKPVIGLYHGMIVGASLNNGTVVDNGVEGSLFDGCTCVMAGDVHKRQVLKRGDIDIVYPGSLIQQTFGETVSQHGFVVWDIEHMTHELMLISFFYIINFSFFTCFVTQPYFNFFIAFIL